MTGILSTIATWGPTVYYSLVAASNLVMPSIIKYQCGSSRRAKDSFPEVFEKVEKLRKDIMIYLVPHVPYAGAVGTNFGPAAVLLINEELLLIDDKTLNYICKHELSHINTSDGFIASSLATTVSAISTYAIPYLQSCLPWWAAPISYCIPFLVGGNTYNVAIAIFEDRADSFASRHATSEELVGIERFVKAQIEVNIAIQPKFPQLFSTDGNTRLALGDINHSPLTKRLEEIRLECRQRKISLEETSDVQAEKLRKLKDFHRNTYAKFSKLKVD